MDEVKTMALLKEGSHFKAIDNITGGVYGSELIIVGGRVTAFGKP